MNTICLFILSAVLAGVGCEVYDPPPEARLELPAEGLWRPDTPLSLRFSEPIDPNTLAITIWPRALDVEGELAPGTEAITSDCTIAAPCSGVMIAMKSNDLGADIVVSEALADRLGLPHLLEVQAGLQDTAGRTVRKAQRFDFALSEPLIPSGGILGLNSGVITFDGELGVANPIPVRLFMRVYATEAGQLYLYSVSAQLRPEFSGSDPPHIAWRPLLSSPGFVHAFIGVVAARTDGSYAFETEPSDITLTGRIPGATLEVFDLKLTGIITPAGGAEGRDQAEGTASSPAARLTIGDNVIDLDSTTNGWVAVGCFLDEVPDGVPAPCTDDPCAAVREAGGDCQIDVPPPVCAR
jgi:hypothetical protein